MDNIDYTAYPSKNGYTPEETMEINKKMSQDPWAFQSFFQRTSEHTTPYQEKVRPTEKELQTVFNQKRDHLLAIANGEVNCTREEAIKEWKSFERLEKRFKQGNMLATSLGVFLEQHFDALEEQQPNLSDDRTM